MATKQKGNEKSFNNVKELINSIVNRKTRKKFLSDNQRTYYQSLLDNEITICSGPAGVGKSFIAMRAAIDLLLDKDNAYEKIIIVRPAVEAEEKLGSLPGNLEEKLDPYIFPSYYLLNKIIGKEAREKLKQNDVIEVFALAYMRGRTLDNAFVILDEGQNTTHNQMKMFLTRMGNNAKFMVKNGIGQGALVNIVRSGQVIPKIVEVVKPAKVSLPKVEHQFNETGADFIALDSSGNQAQLLQYFCKTLGIKYINTSICRHLVEHQIDTPEKMVAMSKETLITLPNMGEKSASKIYNSIHETLSNASPLTLLVGLNILGRNIGMNRLQLVADCLGIETFQLDMEPPPVSKLVNIDGFSDKLAKQLAEGFQNIKSYFNQSPVLNHYYNECLLIYQHLVDEKEGNSDNMAKPYTDFKVVFTGFRDKQLESIITKGGGVIGSAVNKTISHVVSKTSDAKCSGKIAQAQQLGIPTISRGELETLLGL